ncbi:hypothetical protein [uncultured Aquimarina sp.]|uniref:hypothetical protein n=1 Tax=uncultured Aquimarina sp. TaxID=575652 RepID=UPI00260BD24B|nr:hypothetical protein [uncultured Aquimarina sp.]
MRLITIFILIFPIFASAQTFELKKPNVSELNEQLKATNYSKNVVYLYLIRNYKPTSEKFELIKRDFKATDFCAFKQRFEKGIIFSVAKCKDSAETTKLILPKTNQESITEWIELIFKSSPMDTEHNWNGDKTKYGPTDGKSGCYYEITNTGFDTKIDIYCEY